MRVRVLKGLLATLVLVSSALAAPARAAAPAPASRALVEMDRRIHDAHHNLAGWQAWLADWSGRVDVADRAAYLAETSARGAGRPVVEAMLRGITAHRLTSRNLLHEARRRFRRIVHDPEARSALQQAFAWQTYLTQLQTARWDLVMLGRAEGAAAAPGVPVTYGTWARLLLSKLGAPACRDNVLSVVTWETAESTRAAFNPLATTLDEAGSRRANPAGVRHYPTLDAGLLATVDTLTLGAPGYTEVLDALRACAPAQITTAWINRSAWCSGCAQGRYVAGLLAEVRAGLDEHESRLISAVAA
jgi:hypothetical protein